MTIQSIIFYGLGHTHFHKTAKNKEVVRKGVPDDSVQLII